MQKGVVKWFNNAKGYGFILPEDDNGDIFAHYSAIEMEGYKTLKAGQRVSYETEEGPKGLHAVNIQSSEESSSSNAVSEFSQDSAEQSEQQMEEMA